MISQTFSDILNQAVFEGFGNYSFEKQISQILIKKD
jgi:hypothetical protein